MASVEKGVNYTKYAEGGLHNLIGKDWNQPLLTVFDKFTVTTELAESSSVLLGVVPKGGRILGYIFQADDNSAQATGTIEVAGVASTAADAISDLSNGPTKLFIPALDTFSQTALTEDSAIEVQFSAHKIDVGVVMTLTTLYVLD